jgi:hypothetical protein
MAGEYPTTVLPPPGHVIAPSALPGWAPWLAAALMYGSALALAASRRGRVALLTAGGLGVAGTVAALVLTPGVPAAPNYALRLAVPASHPLTSPVPVTVCGRRPDGTAVTVPDAQTLLTVFLDGRQVLETRRPIAVQAGAGAHELRVELLTAGHLEFRPPVEARLKVVVTGDGPMPGAAPCPAS